MMIYVIFLVIVQLVNYDSTNPVAPQTITKAQLTWTAIERVPER